MQAFTAKVSLVQEELLQEAVAVRLHSFELAWRVVAFERASNSEHIGVCWQQLGVGLAGSARVDDAFGVDVASGVEEL